MNPIEKTLLHARGKEAKLREVAEAVASANTFRYREGYGGITQHLYTPKGYPMKQESGPELGQFMAYTTPEAAREAAIKEAEAHFEEKRLAHERHLKQLRESPVRILTTEELRSFRDRYNGRATAARKKLQQLEGAAKSAREGFWVGYHTTFEEYFIERAALFDIDGTPTVFPRDLALGDVDPEDFLFFDTFAEAKAAALGLAWDNEDVSQRHMEWLERLEEEDLP